MDEWKCSLVGAQPFRSGEETSAKKKKDFSHFKEVINFMAPLKIR